MGMVDKTVDKIANNEFTTLLHCDIRFPNLA